MTSLLPSTSRTRDHGTPGPSDGGGPPRGSGDVLHDLVAARPLALLATVGGVAAALGPLLVAMAVGVVGWYLTDGGIYGTPSGGLRVGAAAWLMGHGSGVGVGGVAITAVPLGVTLLAAYVVARVARRVGRAVSGHGPDAAAIGDGARDWTVPTALALFTAGYAVVAVLTAVLATVGSGPAPSPTRVLAWSVVLCLVVAGPVLAVASGRAAIWTGLVPPVLRAAARVARRVVLVWAGLSLALLLGALVADLGTAANVLSQLHTDAGAATLVVLVTLLVVPNATAFSSAYLLGPGFTVGAGTLVTPSAAVLGPLPMFPLLAALPDAGPAPQWTTALLALAPLVALVATVTVQRRLPTTAYDEGALRGLVGGVAAGLVTGLLAVLAGGAVGPGRLAEVGPLAGQVTFHAVVAFGLGGVVGGLLATWWQRRGAEFGPDEVDEVDEVEEVEEVEEHRVVDPEPSDEPTDDAGDTGTTQVIPATPAP